MHLLDAALEVPSPCGLNFVEGRLHPLSIVRGEDGFIVPQGIKPGMFTLVEDVANGLSVFKRGLLAEVANLNPFTESNLARICNGGVHQRIHQGAFTCTIFSDDGYFFTFVNTKGDVLIQRFNAVGLAYFMYRKKVFRVQFYRLLLFIHL